MFLNSRIVDTKFYPEGAPRPAGAVLTVCFLLDGTEYVVLSSGPHFKFSPAVSLVAYCDAQVGAALSMSACWVTHSPMPPPMQSFGPG